MSAKRQKWSPYKVKGPFSTLVCTRKEKNGPSSADQAFSKASCNSCQALSPTAVHPPTSLCPTLSANAEIIFKMDKFVPTDNIQPNFDVDYTLRWAQPSQSVLSTPDPTSSQSVFATHSSTPPHFRNPHFLLLNPSLPIKNSPQSNLEDTEICSTKSFPCLNESKQAQMDEHEYDDISDKLSQTLMEKSGPWNDM